MAARNYTNTATEATLTGSVTSADLTIALTSFAGFPAAPFTAAIDRGTASEEVILVTAVSGSNVTATRGYDGTTAKSHAAGATFVHVTVAKDYTEANGHVAATSGVHGATGAVVGTTDVQTLTNKTLTAPILAGATSTGTHAHASGTFSGTLSVTGATTLAALTATNATLSGTLAVTGAVTMTGAIAANGGITVPTGKKVTLTDAPVAGTDAANKSYADALGDANNTPSTIVRRGATGAITASILFGLSDSPASGDWAANRNYVDAAGTSAATGNTIARRDANGRFQVADPAVGTEAATKNYVDARAPKIQTGAGTITTDASGNFTVNHSLGVAPSAVFVQPRNTNANGGAVYAITAVTSTTFSGRRYYNNAADANNSLAAYWMVTS